MNGTCTITIQPGMPPSEVMMRDTHGAKYVHQSDGSASEIEIHIRLEVRQVDAVLCEIRNCLYKLGIRE